MFGILSLICKKYRERLVHFADENDVEAEHVKKNGRKPGCIRMIPDWKLGCTSSNYVQLVGKVFSFLRPPVMKQ